MTLVLLAALLQGPQSVYHISPAIDITVTVGAGLALGLPYLKAERSITPRCPCDPQRVNALDRGAIGNTSRLAKKLSDVTVGVALTAPLVVDAIDLGGLNETWGEDALVYAQTLAISGALVTATKLIVQRPRPRTYAGDPDLTGKPDGYHSFYSSHTSFTFAALSASAMTMRLRYGEKTWPWVMTAVVGSSVAIERVADGRHFPTDVIVGAVVGTAVGIAVPALHKRDNPGGSGASPRRQGGIRVGWSVSF
jgi:membrane-associated phospholipid phosphatase